ncbi:hypothetical protein [Pseudoxanthomonas mexicana]
MSLEIVNASDQMLPETALPDAALAFCGGGYRVSANPWVPSAKNRP